MKDYVLLNYNYLFSDHMAKCSHQAKLYYIKLMFFANNGFVANPLEILDSLGYDRGIFDELVANEDLLTLPGRSEVFITAYFIHTRFKPASWVNSPFSIYWRGRLYIKKNGVATFKRPIEPKDPLDKFEEPSSIQEAGRNFGSAVIQEKSKWDVILDELDVPDK